MRTRSIVVLALVIALSPAGCATPTEEATIGADDVVMTPRPTPTETPEPSVASIVIEGDRFTTVYEDGTPGDVVFFSSDAATAVALLSDVFGGAPEVADIAAAHCSPSQSIATWSDSFRVTTELSWLPADQQFSVGALAAETSGVTVSTIEGDTVGSSTARLRSTLEPQNLEAFDWEGSHYEYLRFDIEGGTPMSVGDGDEWGAVVLGVDGLITEIVAPVSYHFGGNC